LPCGGFLVATGRAPGFGYVAFTWGAAGFFIIEEYGLEPGFELPAQAPSQHAHQ
jgi:hypothetical protein